MTLPRRFVVPTLVATLALAIAEGTPVHTQTATAPAARPAPGPPSDRFEPMNVFDLEWASDPQVSPDGRRIVYVRHFMDVRRDRRRSTLWMVAADGSDHRALTSGQRNDGSPRWSPDGRRLLYTSVEEGSGVQLYLRWMDTGETARLTNLLEPPGSLAWAPDGRAIAFTMFVPERPQPFVAMPDKPEGATWADPPRVIRRLVYRADGQGYLRDGSRMSSRCRPTAGRRGS